MSRIFVIVLSALLGACSGNGEEVGVSNPNVLPRFAYVVNTASDNITAYRVNSTTGELTSIGATYTTGSRPYSIALSPDNRFAYVTNNGINPETGSVTIFSIDSTTGFLSAIGNSIPMVYPYGIAINRNGIGIVANRTLNTVSSYILNTDTGAMDVVNGSPISVGQSPYKLTVNPVQDAIYVPNYFDDSVSVLNVNPLTGVLNDTFGSPVSTGTGPLDIAVNSDGKRVFVVNRIDKSVSIFSADSSGALTEVANSPFNTGPMNPSSIAVSPGGHIIYIAYEGNDVVQAYSVAQNGSLTAVGLPVETGNVPASVVVDLSGHFVYIPNSGPGANSVSVYSIDQTTGQLTAVGVPVITGSNPREIAILAN